MPGFALAKKIQSEIASNSIVSKLQTIIIKVDKFEEKLKPQDFLRWIEIKPILVMKTGNRAEVENIYYCPLEKIVCHLLNKKQKQVEIQKKTVLSINETGLKEYLDDLSRKVNKDPVDAKFQVEEGRIDLFSLGENGLKLDVDKSFQIINESLNEADSQESKEIKLAYSEIEPQIKSENINTFGIKELIAEGQSNFRGSPKNRIHNIKVATARFNGLLIKPGEEFSFVQNLGEVDGEHGYAPEMVIKKDKTEPEFGGGICQVSTTAFRAALNSGLEITARRNHAYPVQYYSPQGTDATVYIPRPDLKFKNNTPGYILIQTKIEGTILTFQFYGTNDGRKVEIDGPKVLSREPDGSMKTMLKQTVTDKDGNVILNDTFNSSYDSPSKYPHPGEKLTSKPADWSKNEWETYKKANGM